MSGWDQYFSHQEASFTFTAGLRHQLNELAETAFAPEETNFDVFDIANDSFESVTVRTEDDLNRVLDATPNLGVRIISISSSRTINPLRITSPLAARLFERYRVRTEFLRVLLSFGDEPHQSEASSASNTFVPLEDEAYMLLYKLNFVEQNWRTSHDPWSFRHVGVYHQHLAGFDLFILLHCQPASELPAKLDSLVEDMSSPEDSVGTLRRDLCTHPEMLHNLVLSCYLDNWRSYLRYLGANFAKINDMAMIPHAKMDHDIWEIFKSVRDLRNTNDFALFSSACCRSNLEITGCMIDCGKFTEKQTSEFRSMETMLRGYIESSAVLRQRIENTVELAGYTLSLRNQQEMHYLTREMKTHIKETGQVTLKLKNLTENTVDDSAIVLIITIISAIYLPGSFVGTIFGSNYFVFDTDSQRIIIAKDFWVFVAFWLGLTFVTGFVYVLTYMWKRLNSKSRSDEMEEDPACFRFSSGSGENEASRPVPKDKGKEHWR